MSVDYYACTICGRSVYEEYVGRCDKCDKRICTDCLLEKGDIDSSYAYCYHVKCDGTQKHADEHGYDLTEYTIGEVLDDSGIDTKHCPYCNGTTVDDEDLLRYVLNKCGLTHEEAKQDYLKQRRV